ncbi:hypothetical protein HPCPY3281_0384 [Helicobacter pylori CPY3281]|nr:hypothetical protein HPCPY3281_0384 [Helicobacter pylori CPY3281]
MQTRISTGMRDAQIEIGDKKHAIISPRNYRAKALFLWGIRVSLNALLFSLRRHFTREF